MIDAILHLAAVTQLPSALVDENGQPLLSDPQANNSAGDRLHYVRMTPAQLDEWRPHVTVLAEAPYTGTGTADRVYEQIQGSGDKMALYSSVHSLDPIEVDDGEGGTQTVMPPFKFGMLAESALPVPPTITARQARLVLAKNGLLSEVERAIGDIEDTEARQVAGIEWEYAAYLERHAPWLTHMAAQLGMSDADVDAMFIQGETL